MSDVINDFYQKDAVLVRADPAVCENEVRPVVHTWAHTIYRGSDYEPPPCSCRKTVEFMAVPQNREVFEFTVSKGTYRVLHLRGWDYACNPDGILVQRAVYGVFSRCGDDVMTYEWPRACPFTIFPPGIYRVSVFPVPVDLDSENGDGATFDLSVILESVGQSFVDAVTAMGS